MEQNLRTRMWIPFLMRRVFHMSSRLRTCLNKMEWLRGRTEYLLRWQEQCLMSTRRQNTFGRKLWKWLVMPQIGSIYTSFLAIRHMSYSTVTNPKLDTFEYLASSVTFLISIVVQNLLPNLMKGFSLVTDRTLTPTMSTTISLGELKKR